MDIAKERISVQISTQELERRWKAVRQAMEADSIDFLIMQNTNQFLGGYVKWFTDAPAFSGYPTTVVFPREDEMTVINVGPEMDAESRFTDLSTKDWALRGVKNRWTAPYFPTIHYTKTLDAELVVELLKSLKDITIGFVGLGQIPAAFHDYIRTNLTSAKFADATDLVDEIKAVKSEEELALIRRTAEIQDIAMEKAFSSIRPGMRDFEIMALAQYTVQKLGSEQQLIMAASAPLGTPCPMLKRHFMNREIKKGDQFTLMIEVNGPGGLYAELGRTCVLGKASDELIEACEVAKEAQKITLDLLKPGADPKEIIKANNEFLRSKGYPEEKRLYAHGQGYDLVERPGIRADEPMKLQANMNITVHPIVGSARVFAWVCDNYFITETGVSDCIHRTPKKIFEIEV
ncbi:MAG: aminopeptidase P family protein [Deltaproteobacteria bacterium]|nr:aminopeptidase P family protein [Deltaproteobacteria bacterium]